MTNTPPFIGKKYLRYTAWFVAIAVSLLTIAYLGFCEYARYSMRGLNCKTLAVIQFDKSLSRAMSEPRYAPGPGKPVSLAHFKLDLGLSAGDDTFVRIGSDAVDKLVYRGPYTNEFTIEAGEELLGANSGDGGDNFSIAIHQKSTRKVCSGAIESIRPWQANKTVHIKLLPFGELNKLGSPDAFKVYID